MYNHSAVINLRSERLTVIARLKAAQVTQVINAILGEVILIGSRNFLQTALSQYYRGVITTADQAAITDFHLVLESADNAVAGKVYTVDFDTLLEGTKYNTSMSAYPSELFPLSNPQLLNISFVNTVNGYMAGPVFTNGTFYISYTRALTRNLPDFERANMTFKQNVIGYLTVVSFASSLYGITENLNLEDGTRMSLVKLAGNQTRHQARQMDSLNYTFVLPTTLCTSCYGVDFHLAPRTPTYAALVNGSWGTTRNIELYSFGKVAVAYAPVSSISKVWAVLIYQSQGMLYKPIDTLIRILLASVFSIGLGVCLVTFILSGWVVKPITRLQTATKQYTTDDGAPKDESFLLKLKHFFVYKFRARRGSDSSSEHDTSISETKPIEVIEQKNNEAITDRQIRIPEQVVTRKFIKDELTELTETFNEMTRELRKQYEVLEDRVMERTREIKTAKAAAESANEAKSLFIANITHELRTPLNGILGMASVSMSEKDPKTIKESLKIIFKSGELLLRLLTDLLSFSKSQTDEMPLEPREFGISEIKSQLTAIFYEQSRANGINYSINVHNEDEICKFKLMGDMNRILQIVLNLVSNSFKFTPTGGEVRVGILGEPTRNMSILQLAISVTDTGPGIAPHLQKRVFEPFVQGDLDLAVKRGGVGLGLSICQQLAKRMSGRVSVESELGKGSTFKVELPLPIVERYDTRPVMPTGWSTAQAIARYSADLDFINITPLPTSADSQPKSGGKPDLGLKVLVVEDNKVNQEVLIRMLKLEGLKEISIASDGLQAVDAVKNSVSPFDIIFMDIQMPNLDGKEATKIIREKLEYSGVIIAVSAHVEEILDSGTTSVRGQGMNHFLPKPIRRGSLHGLLQGVLNGTLTGTSKPEGANNSGSTCAPSSTSSKRDITIITDEKDDLKNESEKQKEKEQEQEQDELTE